MQCLQCPARHLDRLSPRHIAGGKITHSAEVNPVNPDIRCTADHEKQYCWHIKLPVSGLAGLLAAAAEHTVKRRNVPQEHNAT